MVQRHTILQEDTQQNTWRSNGSIGLFMLLDYNKKNVEYHQHNLINKIIKQDQ